MNSRRLRTTRIVGCCPRISITTRCRAGEQALPASAEAQLAWYVDFVAATAMRLGVEPCNVRFKDIQPRPDDKEPHLLIQVRDGKRGPREVKVNLDVMKIVGGIRALHTDPTDDTLLFKLEETDEGSRFVLRFNQVLKDLGMGTDAAGAPRSLHSLRHIAITDMLAEH
jgi:integrase